MPEKDKLMNFSRHSSDSISQVFTQAVKRGEDVCSLASALNGTQRVGDRRVQSISCNSHKISSTHASLTLMSGVIKPSVLHTRIVSPNAKRRRTLG